MDSATSVRLNIGSRGSALALWQAKFVARLLEDLGVFSEIKTWKTTGDIVQDRFLHEIGGKGLFIRELEDAMKRGEADLAVHSLKDLPAKIPSGFKLAAVLKRHSSSDVIIFKKEIWHQLGLQRGQIIDKEILKSMGPMTIATSSLRRSSLLAGACPNITTTPVRGNVDTRLKKLETEPWQALILAEASLERLGINDVYAHKLDPNWFVPCPGQGALAIEVREDSPYSSILNQLECKETRFAVDIERQILSRLGGDCTMPFGCLVTTDPLAEDQWKGHVIVLNRQGRYASALQTVPKSSVNFREDLENKLIDELRANGANKILEDIGLQGII